MVTSGTDRQPFCINNKVFGVGPYNLAGQGRILIQWGGDGSFIKADTLIGDKMQDGMLIVNENGYLFTSVTAIGPVQFGNNFLVTCPSSQSSAVFALRHDPSILEPYPEDSTGIADRGSLSRAVVRAYPNPTTDKVTVEVMMPLEDDEIYLGDVTTNYNMKRVTVTDLTGKVVLQRAVSGTRTELDFSALPAGTYIITASGEMGEWEGKVVKK